MQIIVILAEDSGFQTESVRNP